jgi:putative endonuclease
MKRELHPCIYILTNEYNKVLYTGVTSNLLKRITEHKSKMVSSFTSRYKVTKLVYYEEYATMDEAITREKQIKGGSRQRKIDLINSKNPEWKDLYDEFFVYHNLVIAKGNSDQRNLPHQEGIASSGKGPSSQ